MTAAAAWNALAESERALLRKKRQPPWMEPMLATLTDEHFSDPGWIYERKLDGVRCLAFRCGDRVRLYSRNRRDMSATYPELVRALSRQRCGDFIVDGEIVAMDGKATSFARLQARMGVADPGPALVRAVPVHLYLFDIPFFDGFDTTRLPVTARKKLLARALRFGGALAYTEHRAEHGVTFLEEACRQGWEGLIAKLASGTYACRRSRDWLKFKCLARQELVIGGYTDPTGARTSFGALLVGYYERGRLRYAGKVGTGFTAATLESLGAKLRRLTTDRCPFEPAPRVRGAHWARPALVGEFGFTEWTNDGKLRHPRFYGLRTDKKAGDVRRERPKA
ncbi:MAG TPA: non-homologous end-joining DNA ligase [Candidatus Limnocylindrales bacterium]|nr:non-homologous end-joining DNA ligase [Candidatus Limnocylindrales bacterium]